VLSAVSVLHQAAGIKPISLSNPVEALSRATMCGALLEEKAGVAVAVIAEFIGMVEAGLTEQEARPLVQDVGTELAGLLIAVYRVAHIFKVNIDDIVFNLENSMRHAFPE
jgi:hypothetical protein